MKTEPVPSDQITFGRYWPLLILRRELQAAHLVSHAIKRLPALPLGMQDIPAAAPEHFVATNGDVALLDRDGGKIEMAPSSLPEQMAGEIVFVPSLHDHDDRTPLFIVKAGDQCAAKKVDHPVARDLRHGLLELERIVHNNVISSAPGKRATNRAGIPAAASRGHELRAGVLCGPHRREERAIPGGLHHHAKLAV